VESADLTGRYFKFRIICETYNPQVKVKLMSTRIDIDVLERTISLQDIDITNAIGGVSVSFTPPFRNVPAIAVTIDGNTHAVGYEVVSKDRTQATIRLIDMVSGNPTTGRIDLSAVGWGKVRSTSI
jgi:hypothetical protein